ncbi:phage holin family protein [Alkalibacter saccharofermentans]|uniref:Toxin secretion/phage lysis holin n=1 Tax=Alkalibacter saccharofermentans DSM 14828 TaxID=1120975 RepID=A0A1M4XMN2_9FIRM|nr:phage holin family protein [Alkalibacter saccharofermentans]SHE94680.1 toxin secretion/phage lysis holin [Alkalibacter saccharofermentans DSM 14828]
MDILEMIRPKIMTLSPWEKIGIMGIAAALVRLVGGFDQSMQTLVLFIVIDYVTGVILALYKNNLSSEACYRGILKKGIIFFIVILAHHTDMIFETDSLLLRNCTIIFYIGNEGISIMENAGEIGIPMPAFMRRVLRNLKEKNEELER